MRSHLPTPEPADQQAQTAEPYEHEQPDQEDNAQRRHSGILPLRRNDSAAPGNQTGADGMDHPVTGVRSAPGFNRGIISPAGAPRSAPARRPAPPPASRTVGPSASRTAAGPGRSEEHTSELQSPTNLVCR